MGQAALALPTLQEEIDRKTFETLEWLVLGITNAKFTPEQFSMGVNVLFLAVSGLAGRDFIHLISDADALSSKEPVVVKRIFRHPSEDEIRTFTWRPDEDKFTVVTRIKGMVTNGFVKDCMTPKKAVELIENVAKRITEQGWTEL